MTEWICINRCQWGETSKQIRIWKVGDTIQREERPNKHFVDATKVNDIFDYKEANPSEISYDEMLLMTKAQLNEKFNLGMEKKDLHFTKKDDVIKMAIDNTNAKRISGAKT